MSGSIDYAVNIRQRLAKYPTAYRETERADMFGAAIELERLRAFHDAWIEAEVASATGDPDLARSKRRALVTAHQIVRRPDQPYPAAWRAGPDGGQEEEMRRSLIGQFVNWWLHRQGWPTIFAFDDPPGAGSMPPAVGVDYNGNWAWYVRRK